MQKIKEHLVHAFVTKPDVQASGFESTCLNGRSGGFNLF